ncbi:MAG: type II toxin-antitoxin system VapC family toxin [Planctomycetaceae bacterium]|nr:type II toxin-antitoxin system VapC family toxin [Planctomycetaceae bacterium]
MNILIDTCDALWFFSGDKQLKAKRRRIIEDPGNAVFLSTVSASEIAIKHSIGKLPLPEPPHEFIPRLRVRHHFAELPLYESASLLLASLPLLHRDPFDRMLICQSLAHGLFLLTSDPRILQYPGIRTI